MTGHQRAVEDFRHVALATAFHHSVKVAWSNESFASAQGIAVLCFLHPYDAIAVKALRKSSGENFGHVLHNDNRWTIGRHSCQNNPNRLRATSRCAHGNQAANWRRGPRSGSWCSETRSF